MQTENDGLKQRDLEDGFQEIGVRQGMMLEVHSSLSSFGHVDGGAEAVIAALMNLVGKDGAIVMPTFPVSKRLPLTEIDRKRGLTYKIRIFDEASNEPSGMGIISDTFRRMPEVITGKGMHRVSAWGRECHRNSQGLANIIENGGYALLIGVDIYRLTSMHYMEKNLPQGIRDTYEASDEVLVHYSKDHWYIETANEPEAAGEPMAKAWYKIQNEAYRGGMIHEKTIGKSKCMFFMVSDVVRLYEKAIETDPYGLFGINKKSAARKNGVKQ